MPNMVELISKKSAKITKSHGEIWMSKIDQDYAYGQSKLSKETSKHCVFKYWRQFHGILPIQEKFSWSTGLSYRFLRAHRQSPGV